MKRPLLACWLAWLLAAGLAGSPAIHAQQVRAYPSKPVRILVAAPAGAGSDVIARTFAEELSGIWRKPVTVVNLDELSTALAQTQDARPDGHVLLASGTPLMLLLAQRPTQPGHSGPDAAANAPVTGISQIAYSPQLLLVRPGSGIGDLAGLIASAQRAGHSIGVGGRDGISHLTGQLLATRSGAALHFQHFTGGAQESIAALLGGSVDAVMVPLASAAEQAHFGRVIALAVASPGRAKALPMVPTLHELGLQEFDMGSWQGLFAPPGTPSRLAHAIYQGVQAALIKPQVNHTLDAQGFTLKGIPPADTDRLMAGDVARYRQLLQSLASPE